VNDDRLTERQSLIELKFTAGLSPADEARLAELDAEAGAEADAMLKPSLDALERLVEKHEAAAAVFGASIELDRAHATIDWAHARLETLLEPKVWGRFTDEAKRQVVSDIWRSLDRATNPKHAGVICEGCDGKGGSCAGCRGSGWIKLGPDGRKTTNPKHVETTT